jgi:subtilisin family serine protease
MFTAFKARGQEGEDPEPVDPRAVGAPAPERERLGEGVRVALIDTGIAEEALQDPWLKNILAGPADIDKLQEIESGTDGSGQLLLDLQAGHGTMVAGVLREVAPGCEVEIIRALDTEGVATEEELGAAIQEAVRRGCEIINMSFGGFTNRDLPPLGLERVIADVPGDVLLVAAAGNFFDDRPVWPAAIRRIVSVAALRQRGDDADPVVPELDWYSSFGWWVDVAAPGKWNTPFVSGVEHELREAGPDASDVFAGFAEAAGTSLAAAAMSGAIAVELSRLRQDTCDGDDPTPRDGLRAVLARAGNVRLAHGTVAVDVWER